MKRVAMWSGPRNISTALMRAFENREDCVVVDEPFYGYYLQRSGIPHPGDREIIAAMECDWRAVARNLCEALPPGAGGASLYYQKQMTHHLLPEVELAFTDRLLNCFLIREPRRIIASYVKVRPEFTLEELGFPQQLALFRRVADRLGEAPPVIDSQATLCNPEASLRALCERLQVPFSERMLNWPAGRRDSDGVWAPHWYASVEASTGWAEPPRERDDPVPIPAQYEPLCEQAGEIYAELYRYALLRA